MHDSAKVPDIPKPAPGTNAPGPAASPEAALLDGLPWGVWVVDEHYVVRRLNAQAAAWCGVAPNALVGQPLPTAAPDEGVLRALYQVLTQAPTAPYELQLPHTEHWLALTYARQPDGWVVYGQDITPQKCREQQNAALAASEAKYRALLNSMDEGFCTVQVLFDAQGQATDYRFLEANPAFEQQTGLLNAVGRTMRELAPTHEEFWFETYGRVARTGEPVRLEHEAAALGRFYDVYAFRIGAAPENRVAILFHNVAARKRAEEALRRSEEQLRLFVTASSDILYRMDAGWQHLLPLDGRHELAATTETRPAWLEAYIPPTDQPAVEAAIQAAIADRHFFTLEHRVVQADGSVGWTSSHAVPVLDEHGELVEWFGTATDITARKQVEEALRQSEERLRMMMNVPHVGVLTFRLDGMLLTANDAFLDLMGYGRAEFEARTFTWQDFTPPEYAAASQRQLEQVRQTGRSEPYEKEYLRRDGSRQWFMFVAAALGDGTLVEYAVDIAARKQAEAALQASEQRYRTLFKTMDQGFCLLEVLFDEAGQQAVDYRYLELNAVFVQQSGMPAEARGKTIRELMPDVEPFWFDTFGRVALTGEAVRLENHVPQLGRWFDVHAFRVGPPDSHEVAVFFTDITARKQQEQQQTFLLRFSDALRAETSAPSVAYRALGMLCEQLQLDRCYIGIYDLAEDRGIFPQQVGNHRIPPLPAEVRLSDFPDALRVAYDQTLRIDDLAHTEGLSDTDRQNLGALGLRALVAATLRRVGAGPQWAIVALSADVRHWTPGEVALLEEATERTWAAMERARAEEAQHESEERFRAVANLVPDLLWRSTPDNDTTWYNQRWYEYTGQTPAEAARYGWTDAIHPDDRADSSHRYHAAVVSGQPLLQEHRIRSAQGEYRWFQVQARPLRNEYGTVTAWYGAATDIHARKLAEEALRHAEERHRAELEQQVAARTEELRESRNLLKTVFDASPTAIVVMRLLRDAAGRVEDFEILIFNEFNKQVVGRDDIVGQRFTVMFPQTVPTGILARLLAVATTGEPVDFEQWYEGEGMRHWFRHIVVRQDGLLVLTSEVITARKQAEQERLRNLRLLEQAEAVAGLGSWDYDLRGGEFLWSDGMYRLFGLPLGQAVSPDIYLQFVVDEDRPQAEELLHFLTTGCGSFEQTLRLRVSEQVKTVRIKAVVLHDDEGQPVRVLGVDLDISQLQHLEQENLRLRLRQQRALFEAVQAAQETERRRMAEGLHNGIGQLLYATKLRLDQLHAPVLYTLPALVAARQEADRLLGEAIRQTRALSHELVPMMLEEFGLEVAVRDIGRKMSTLQLHFACQVLLDEAAGPLPPALQVALYRMTQELALNIVKHAHGATEASLELETMPGWALLRAHDNGPGFGQASLAAPGLGLRSIRDRVELLGGVLEAGNADGAYVRLRIPLTAPL